MAVEKLIDTWEYYDFKEVLEQRPVVYVLLYEVGKYFKTQIQYVGSTVCLPQRLCSHAAQANGRIRRNGHVYGHSFMWNKVKIYPVRDVSELAKTERYFIWKLNPTHNRQRYLSDAKLFALAEQTAPEDALTSTGIANGDAA